MFVSDCLFNSSFVFLSNHGALVTLTVKATLMMELRARMLEGLNYAKRC